MKSFTELINIYGDENSAQFAWMNKGDIILVSSTQYRDFSKEFIRIFPEDKYRVSRIIIDEADTIKISRMIKINSIFSWFITSSFTSLQNPHGNDCFWHKINRIRDIYGNAGYVRR